MFTILNSRLMRFSTSFQLTTWPAETNQSMDDISGLESPSKVRIRQLSEKLTELQDNIREEKYVRRYAALPT